MNLTEYQNYHETKSHTNADFPYNTYLCSIPLDFIQVPLHWHEEIEFIVIKKGQGLVSVNLQTREITAGDIVFILPGQLHSIRQKDGCSMEYENILFKPALLVSDSSDLCTTQFLQPLLSAERAVLTFLTPSCLAYADLAGCISHIDDLCAARPEGYQLAVKGYLFQFFVLLVSSQTNRDSAAKIKAKSLEKLKTILKYVEEHYADTITIADMAALTFYSKSHFMKFFKGHMDMGFTEYLNDYRLSMAARLLAASGLSVLEIATRTGFDNLSYFNRLFKRKYGQTPREYRKALTD